MVHCTECGHKNKKGVKFCTKCGKKLKQEIEVKEMKKSTSNGISKKIFFPIIIVLIIGAIVLGVFLAKYVSSFNDLQNLYAEQKVETTKYKNMYGEESNLKSQEIRARQVAEAESERLGSSLSYEQQQSASVQGQLQTTQSALEQSQTQVATVKAEVTDLFYTLNNLETFVKSSSKLSSSRTSKIHSLCGDPLQISGGNCIINTNEMGKDMTSCIGFTWTDDTVTSNFADGQRIFDPDTFWLSKEGDCDDFGLFMAAWLRSEYERAKSTCGESNIYIQVDAGGVFSDPKYISCPCDFYAIGGHITKWGGGYHMETGISKKGASYPSSIHIIEPQSGSYDGIGNGNVMDEVIWVFSDSDFLVYSGNTVSNSISLLKNKLNKLK